MSLKDEYTLRLDASPAARLSHKMGEPVQMIGLFGGGLSSIVALLTSLVLGLNANEVITPGVWVWMGISLAVFLPILYMIVRWEQYDLGNSTKSAEATKIYNSLNKGHKEMSKAAVLSIYEMESNGTSQDEKAIEKRITLLKQVRAKERTEATARRTEDNSDIVALSEYVNNKALANPTSV